MCSALDGRPRPSPTERATAWCFSIWPHGLLLPAWRRRGGEQRQGVPVDLGLADGAGANGGASRPAVNRVPQTLAARGSISIDGRHCQDPARCAGGPVCAGGSPAGWRASD
jgi:hypothetical protein